MKVKAKITAVYKDKGRLKATATVCLGGCFLITGVRVSDCEKGLCVFMPSRKTEDGAYKDICFPITSELYKQMKDTVLEAYESYQPEMEQAETEDTAADTPQAD